MAGKSRDSKTVVLDLDRLGRAEPEGGDWAAEEVRPRPPKRLLSLRVDADVLEFFRSQGPGWQSRMNAVLRAYMEHRVRR
ncbi:BrnA antitoxin family protein [Desulfovibrio aminophilus]|nr:BrnA antitoxin family protein [Desulfovibrio aminophilus]MCM0756597.1 BrnA antitoxin family protein [Desulfovibrio aminophilus]